MALALLVAVSGPKKVLIFTNGPRNVFSAIKSLRPAPNKKEQAIFSSNKKKNIVKLSAHVQKVPIFLL